LANGVDTDGDKAGGLVFKSTGEALVAIAEMRMQIREQGLGPEAAIDLVVRRTQEISRSCGILVGLRQQNSVVYPARTGVAATMGAAHFQANLFQFCLRTGRTMQLRDVQKHSHVGATCRQQGIGSLIIVPIFRNEEIAGAIEFLFQERRAFSISNVLDIELIAGVIGKSLNGSEQMQSQPTEEREGQPSPRRSKTSSRKSGMRGPAKQV
jgi:LytS/YehU family sensor histidine kinase